LAPTPKPKNPNPQSPIPIEILKNIILNLHLIIYIIKIYNYVSKKLINYKVFI